MQYTVALPADYDMNVIRARVARTGSKLDGFGGLLFKAYLIREKSNGAPGNEYAPFYVWSSTEGMRAFCFEEPGYVNIVRDFGRHPIQNWTVAGLATGPADAAVARSATIAKHPVAEGAPGDRVRELSDDFLRTLSNHTVWRVAAVDVTSWTLLLVEISTEAPVGAVADGEQGYEVLHVSLGSDRNPFATSRPF